MKSPTQRSLKKLKDDGYIAQVVERWNPWSRTRLDLFDAIDIVAVHETEKRILGVQATSGSNTSKRLEKARLSRRLAAWIKSGGQFEVWGWVKKCKKRKDGKKGKSKVWEVNIKTLNN